MKGYAVSSYHLRAGFRSKPLTTGEKCDRLHIEDRDSGKAKLLSLPTKWIVPASLASFLKSKDGEING